MIKTIDSSQKKFRIIKNRRIFLIIIFSLLWGFMMGQNFPQNEEEFAIDFIDVRKGLLSNFVTKTISDDDNIKYFATEDGISKFDGYDFTDYRPSSEFKGLENENVETLFKDKNNNIWIGTKAGGLSMLEIRTNKIFNFNHLFSPYTRKKLRIISINQNKQGFIWVGTWNKGVFVVDPINNKLVTHYPFIDPINNIIKDSYDDMWFISGSVLYQYNQAKSKLVKFAHPKPVFNLIEDKVRNKIWLVGNSGMQVHLYSFSFKTQKFSDEKNNISARFIKSIALDEKNRLWLGSWGDGLYISDAKVTKFRKINTNPEGRSFNNINNSIILDIDIDKNGIAWLSTAYGGVLMLYPNKGFKLLNSISELNAIDQNIASLYKDRAGNLYKGKLAEGLFVGVENGKFSKISDIPDTRINCFFEKDNLLFIGTNVGLYLVKDRQFNKAKSFFKGDKITAILLDSQRNLWLGTQQKGLKMTNLALDPELKNFKLYTEEEKYRTLDNNRINHIKEDNFGNIWLATYAGLNLYDKQHDTFLNHSKLLGKSLPNVIINDIHIKAKEIYLGTPSGFAILEAKLGKISIRGFYDRKNGLINDFICGIEEDKKGNIWLSTTTSITKYSKESNTFVNFGREDGVMINSFHIGSSFSSSDGIMYFGGSNGIIRFNPLQIREKINSLKIIFTQLIINNNVLEAGEVLNDNEILHQSIQYTDKIDLAYSQNHLSLSFNADDFLGPDNIFYSYQLVGFKD